MWLYNPLKKNVEPEIKDFFAQKELDVLKESIEYAVRESSKKCSPIYLVPYNGSIIVENDRPPVGICLTYIKVEGEDVFKVEVDLESGREYENLVSEDYEYIVEEKILMKSMLSPESNEPGVLVGYEVKRSGGKTYYSFDGGVTWENKKDSAYQKAKNKKDRRIGSKASRGMAVFHPESARYSKEIIKAAKGSLKEADDEENSEAKEKFSEKDILEMAKEGSGFGYFGHEIRDPKNYVDPQDRVAVKAIDNGLVAAANKNNLEAWQLAAYGDSKTGRTDADKLAGTILDLNKTGADLYLKDPETVFKKSYDFFMVRLPRFLSKMTEEQAEELKSFWAERI